MQLINHIFGQKRTKVMRYIGIMMFLLCINLHAQGSKFVLLPQHGDLIKGTFSYNKYTLRTDQLYKVNRKLELHNFLIPSTIDRDERLLLITILPDFSSDSSWRTVSPTEIVENMVSIEQMLDELFVPQFGIVGNSRKFLNEYIAVVELDGKFMAAKNCLVETFTVRNVSPIFPTGIGVLNLKEQTLPLSYYMEIFKRYFPRDPIPFEIGKKFSDPNYRFGAQLGKEYLSKTFLIKGVKAYQFYTVASDNSADYYHIEKGITRLVYTPGKGIIGGSFDFYFLPPNIAWLERNPSSILNNLTVEEWNNNIFSEKVMLADDL